MNNIILSFSFVCFGFVSFLFLFPVLHGLNKWIKSNQILTPRSKTFCDLVYRYRIDVLLPEEEVQADPGPRKWQIRSFFIFCFISLGLVSAPGERSAPACHIKVSKFIHSQICMTIFTWQMTIKQVAAWLINKSSSCFSSDDPHRSRLLQWYELQSHVFLEQHTWRHWVHNIRRKEEQVRRKVKACLCEEASSTFHF